jgi:hypothetical protein
MYKSLYVYGVVDGRFTKRIQGCGIGNRQDDVVAVPFKDVTAIVSETPFEEYDPTEENIVAHEQVIQEVLKYEVSIAPMRFCTIVKSKRDLLRLLGSGYAAFKRNLIKIKHRHEFDVKVFLNIEQAKKDTDDLVEESRLIASSLYAVLQKRADDAVLSDQVTREMILNASFLVRKEQREEFRQTITCFDKEHENKLKIRVSGPTAPYNFVSMPTS